MKKSEGSEHKSVDYINLHAVTHQKINYIISKAHINQADVYYTAKEFFQGLLQLDYEFTHEELLEEFEKTYLDRKTHDKLKDFIKTVGQMEYSTKQFSQKELKVLLEDMRAIINSLLSHHKRKQSLTDKLRSFFFPKQYKIDDITAFEELQSKVDAEEAIIDSEIQAGETNAVEKLISDIYQAKDVTGAKIKYRQAIQYYNTLNEQEQKQLYVKLMDAYTYIQQKAQV